MMDKWCIGLEHEIKGCRNIAVLWVGKAGHVLLFLCALLLTVVGLFCIELLSHLCLFLLPYVCCFTMRVLLSYILYLPDCWIEVSIRKVLRPTTSAQVFLGFLLSKSEC